MTKAKKLNTTNRRAFLAAVPAVALAAALPSLPADADPIFSKINAHREAAATFWVENSKLTDVVARGNNWMPSQAAAALMAAYAAGDELIATAPTTRAGVRALERHLRDEKNSPGSPWTRARVWNG
jgi:hypothetical protein